MAVIGIGSGLLALGAIYSRIQQLAGWNFHEAMILLGSFQLLSGLLGAFVNPNLTFFREKIISGAVDDYLLRPLPSLFTASFWSASPMASFNALPGASLIVVGTFGLDDRAGLAAWLLFACCLASGLVIAWAYRVLLACLSFWAPGSEPSVLYDALWELGRFPTSIYPRRFRMLLTTVVPVAFIGSIPAAVLTGHLAPVWGVIGVAAAGAAFSAARLVWAVSLRRYSSASS